MGKRRGGIEGGGLAVKLPFLAGVRVPKYVFGRWGIGGKAGEILRVGLPGYSVKYGD